MKKPVFNRLRLPDERPGTTHKFRIGDVEGYLTTGHYEDGTLGEIFVKMGLQGQQTSGFIDAWAIAVSMLLQAGCSVDAVVAKYRGIGFEPSGVTGNPAIPFAKSPIDYVVRWIGLRYGSQETDS